MFQKTGSGKMTHVVKKETLAEDTKATDGKILKKGEKAYVERPIEPKGTGKPS